MATSEKHERILKETIENLKEQGYHCFDLERKSPDAIAVKNNKVYAVEILGRQHKIGKGWRKKFTVKQKQSDYHMFDGLIIRTFRLDGHSLPFRMELLKDKKEMGKK